MTALAATLARSGTHCSKISLLPRAARFRCRGGEADRFSKARIQVDDCGPWRANDLRQRARRVRARSSTIAAELPLEDIVGGDPDAARILRRLDMGRHRLAHPCRRSPATWRRVA